MNKISFLLWIGVITAFCVSCNRQRGNNAAVYSDKNMFEYNDVETRWSSFENSTAEKGNGGKENKGAKGHAMDVVKAGESVTLLNIDGPGIVNRIWATINDRSPEMLRALKIEMFWDDNDIPAVSVPFGDFFGIGLGKKTAFENALFADPEGRSFNCFIKMPFKKSAKIVVTNENDKDLDMLFYDINLVKLKAWNPNYLYFHCYWHRDTATTLGEDFQILPAVNGKGRYLGANIGVNANPAYKNLWWGEGEVKMYVDGDSEFPTLVGSGTEDYIGTAWKQGKYALDYSGCLIADNEKKQWAFYRYHIPDPIYFSRDVRVTIQQIGGGSKNFVQQLLDSGVALTPISIHDAPDFYRLLTMENYTGLNDENLPNGWTNFYRSDDVSAAAYFYLNQPVNNLPPLQNVSIRVAKL